MSSKLSLTERLERIYYLAEKRNRDADPGLSKSSGFSSIYVDENTDALVEAPVASLDSFDATIQHSALEMKEHSRSMHKWDKYEAENEIIEIFGSGSAKPHQIIKVIDTPLNPSMCHMLSLMNDQFSDEQVIQIEEERESLGLSPIYKCLEIPHHIGVARNICFEITKSLSTLPNCIQIVAHWCRSRIFHDTSMEIENRWIMMHIFFSYIDFGIITKTGVIFFSSFSELIDLLKIPVAYGINKHRFAFPKDVLDDMSENENELMEVMFSKCFYAPQYKSDKNAEVKNFAHNDVLHEFSTVFRQNLICALIYYRLRSVIHDRKVFESHQRIFKNGCEYLNYLLYTKTFKHPVAPEMKQFLMNLRRTILDQRLFTRFYENMYKYDTLLRDD